MRPADTNGNGADAETLALQALVWLLSDEARTQRLTAITGLDGDTLRSGLGETAILGAIMDYLAGHEADMIACAQALGCAPEALTRARARLSA